MQRHLADLEALRDPRRLDVVDVVEKEARDGLREQVVERGRRLGDGLAELAEVWLERPRDERAEAVHLILQVADQAHVLDALLERLDVAVHHRGRRRHAQAVRVAHDPEPLRRARLLGREDLAHAVDEDLGATSGQRVQAGVAQAREHLGRRQATRARDVLDLGRRERVQVDRVALLDAAEEVLVPVDREIGVVPALHQHRGPVELERLLDLLEDHGLRQDVALAPIARLAVERAEGAVGLADVRVVDVPVDDEGDLIRIRLAAAQLVGGRADRDEVAAAQQDRGVLGAEPLARERALEDLGDRSGLRLDGCHQRIRAASMKRSGGTDAISPRSAASS